MLSHKIPVKAHYCWIIPKNLKNSCRRCNFIWSLVYFQCAWCWMKAHRKFFHVLWVVSLPLCVLLLTVPTVCHIHTLSGKVSNKMFHLSKSSSLVAFIWNLISSVWGWRGGCMASLDVQEHVVPGTQTTSQMWF